MNPPCNVYTNWFKDSRSISEYYTPVAFKMLRGSFHSKNLEYVNIERSQSQLCASKS